MHLVNLVSSSVYPSSRIQTLSVKMKDLQCRHISGSILLISLLCGTLSVVAENTSPPPKRCLTNPPLVFQPDIQHQCPSPIDESIGPEPIDWSPWTHRPSCVEAEKNPAIQYCVYSNSQHGSHGISLITKPETAAISIEMLNEKLPPVRPRNNSNHTTRSYQVVDMPGKGKGVIATRKIVRAEVIMSDWASVLLDLSFPKAVQKQSGHQLFHLAADQLSNPDVLLELGRSSTTATDIVEDILGTNAFSYTLGGDAHMALYPQVAVGSRSSICSL